MKLLVDIGNSRIKWTTLDSGRFTESHSFDRKKTGIKTSFTSEWKELADIDAIYVSNVGGDKIAEHLTDWSEKKWQITPKFISSEQKRFGVTNAYQQADKLGVDRWLALIAARQHARQATCIIDCGTAITIDVVTKYGAHQGGMILPGITLMRETLSNSTSNLNDVVEDSEFKTLAVNTQSAIQSGTLYMVTASLERIVDDLNEQFNNRIRFIITGGDATIVMPLLPSFIAHYPDIVLKGLGYYARQGDRQPRAKPEAPKVVDVTEVVEAPKAVEVTEVVEVPKVVEVTEAVEAPKVIEVAEVVEVPKAVEVTEAVEAPKVIEVAEVVEAPKAVEVTEVVEAPKVVEVTEAVEVAEVVEAPKAVKVAEVVEAVEVTEVVEAPKVVDVTEVVEVPKAVKAPKAVKVPKAVELQK